MAICDDSVCLQRWKQRQWTAALVWDCFVPNMKAEFRGSLLRPRSSLCFLHIAVGNRQRQSWLHYSALLICDLRHTAATEQKFAEGCWCVITIGTIVNPMDPLFSCCRHYMLNLNRVAADAAMRASRKHTYRHIPTHAEFKSSTVAASPSQQCLHSFKDVWRTRKCLEP